MRYIAKQRARFEAICGPVNLAYGTPVVCEGGMLTTADGRPLCGVTSQNAFDHFARDDDGQGRQRGRLIAEIQQALEKDPARWGALWGDAHSRRFRRADHEDFWVWSCEFYNATIPELEYLLNLCKEVAA